MARRISRVSIALFLSVHKLSEALYSTAGYAIACMWLCSLTCSLGFGVLEPLGFLQVQREYGTAMPLAHKAIAVCRDLLWPGPGLAGRHEALPAPCRLQAACHQPHPPPSPPPSHKKHRPCTSSSPSEAEMHAWRGHIAAWSSRSATYSAGTGLWK